MKRKEFVRKGLLGVGSIVALPAVVSCSKDDEDKKKINNTHTGNEDCNLSPSETAGPFPIKTPADLVKANIVSDRTGVALLVTLTIQDQSNECAPLEGVYVDIWHCDKDGYYSEYGGTPMQPQDFTNAHFLRGRQKTDTNGQISFISIYPGWYPGRAPHIHLEVLDENENSLRVTQIAFPESISNEVYKTAGYKGQADTSNSGDGIFANSLSGNMADSVTGNTADGYTLLKTIVV